MNRCYFLVVVLALGFALQGSSSLGAELLPAAYFPLAVGNEWVYESSEGTEATPVVESWRVARQEEGAFVLQIKQSYVTADGVEEFFVSTAAGLRRLDRQTASPETTEDELRFFLKAPLSVGATWKNADGTYTVTASGKTITVPAGTFTNCVEVTHQSTGGRVTVVTLYAPSVGVVQRDERFPIVGSGIGDFDASQLGGMGGFDAPQQGHAVLRLKEWKVTSP
jgi:hypothetical protein